MAIPGVALVDNFRPSGIDAPIVLTRAFTFLHTGTETVIEEASWTLAARLTVCGILGEREGHKGYKGLLQTKIRAKACETGVNFRQFVNFRE